jgi:hypothetical protein
MLSQKDSIFFEVNLHLLKRNKLSKNESLYYKKHNILMLYTKQNYFVYSQSVILKNAKGQTK